MKKILLSLLFISAFVVVKAQTVLNEIYTEPGSGKSEFFELYNTSGFSQNVDCFTILIYWKNSTTDRGWYVLDLPNATVPAAGFFVGSSANPFNVQSQTGVTANFNWNDISFRNGSTGGFLKKYKWKTDNTGYTDLGLANTTAVNDLFTDVSVGGGHNYIQLVYVNGVFSNAFWGGGSSSTLPSEITTMTGLPVDMSGSCSDFTATFNFPVEYSNQSPGSDNGFARKFDGKCGVWNKTSASLNHTPGTSNGGASGAAGDLIISAFITCTSGSTTPSEVTYNITGVSGAATEANSFPVTVKCYNDVNKDGQLDATDILIGTHIDNLISDPAFTFTYMPKDADILLVFQTSQGCFDKVLRLISACSPLPVKLNGFDARRFGKDVVLTWNTTAEENNKGFDIERANGNGGWEKIGFVESKVANGGGSAYQFTDFNNMLKGISQYRLKQIDLDNRSSYSPIRSVRGEGQIGKTILYPNPSTDGIVNIVFEDGDAIRNVTVFDINGRTVKQWKGITNNNIRMDNLQAGFYSVRIVNTATNEQVVEKFVVNKR